MLDILYWVFFKDFISKVAVHKNNLAKFGYILDMKVDKKQNHSIFLPPYWNLNVETGNFQKKTLSKS
jgi:hypothetical protein